METKDLQSSSSLSFEFTGQFGEFFRIWIVNLVLTILTLGIYSAWAKVRTQRYFYANTRLAGATFDYLAGPMMILKGRLIAVGFFILYLGLTSIAPPFDLLASLLFLIAMPWVVNKALAFRAHNSAYRNIRFGFEQNYSKAIKVFIGLPILLPLSLGLLYPFFDQRRSRFILGQSRYGTSAFAMEAPLGRFYKTYLLAGLLLLGVFFLGGMLGSRLFESVMTMSAQPAGEPPVEMRGSPLGLLPILVGYLLVYGFIKARIANLIWNHTDLNGHRFESHMQARKLIVLLLTNALAIILSLGLLIPWAKIRMARYRAETLQFIPQGDLDGFLADQAEQVAATGEGVGDVFDVDLGL
ncbi:YjgN family protein [endosymbiont of Ridgeia piscesae]|jgi:uncharacterized membrane protein YjgN (DUF898 family)|uniref:Uncharacterized membrane protein YjgN, DUF898 family n=1 Tax=endosymbiont of Ridgeia piscesae TaxID=54398 RepID=A0A0T5Z370_9GAMM|nr:YjgN family protein [endosymbiont of Ridgeia piscesae]KRT55546.1 Uncharacterized membrane protein YjgN, DUF898 family [endosymbiont of Ridgeia piscesae]KRT57370.1 Uncharacterized membrane protein YjgN, DUF898 family [endosymbiont of Ridgeia piscesae]